MNMLVVFLLLWVVIHKLIGYVSSLISILLTLTVALPLGGLTPEALTGCRGGKGLSSGYELAGDSIIWYALKEYSWSFSI